jgi:hypothetical protein
MRELKLSFRDFDLIDVLDLAYNQDCHYAEAPLHVDTRFVQSWLKDPSFDSSCKRAIGSFHGFVFYCILPATIFHLHIAQDSFGRTVGPTVEIQTRVRPLYSSVPSLPSNAITNNQRYGSSC